MSNPDSFIEEVTEEVRRDRLFAAFRKYGWIGGLIVVAIVGGAAWSEWQKSQASTRAQGFGDALMEALDTGGEVERREALEAVSATGSQAAIKALMLAGDVTGDKAAALAALDGLAADASQPEIYRDLAVLRRVMLAGTDQPLAERRAALDGISAAGRAFRPLAAEQLAYLLIEEGKRDEAIAALSVLMQDQDAPQALQGRVAQVITALGGALPKAAAPADQG